MDAERIAGYQVTGRRGSNGRQVRIGSQATTTIDLRCEPLMVRDGCSPDRIPAGRWPSDGSLVRSEQFAVNQAIAQPGLFAVHAPPGTGVAEVFCDLVAAATT